MQNGKHAKGLHIAVLPDDFGSSSLEDMKEVCVSAAETIWSHLPGDDSLAPIYVRRSEHGPMVLFQRGEGNEHIVKLDTADECWAQLAYQFAHEFCHILCNYREDPNPQCWFEETLCHIASLYALRRMAQIWQTKAPYPNWISYAFHLKKYADNHMKKYDNHQETIVEWYLKHQTKIEQIDHHSISYIVLKLLPVFEQDPSAGKLFDTSILVLKKKTSRWKSIFRDGTTEFRRHNNPSFERWPKSLASSLRNASMFQA